MKIVVAVKVVPDDQDIFVSPDRSLDYSKAKPKPPNTTRTRSRLLLGSAANDGSQVIAISAVPIAEERRHQG